MLSSHPGYSAGRPGTRFLINLLKDAAKLWVGRAELFSYVRLLLQTARCDLQAFCDSVTRIGSSCLRLWAAALQPAEQGRIPDVLRASTKLAQRAILWIGFHFSACISRAEC